MANKLMKKDSTSALSRGIQIEPTRRHLPRRPGGSVDWCYHWGGQWTLSSKPEDRPALWSTVPLLIPTAEAHTRPFSAALFLMAPSVHQQWDG